MIALAALVATLLVANARLPAGKAIYDEPFRFDFTAFYCAGAAVAEHRDPYLAEPLRSCEHAVPGGWALAPGLAIPAPLPGYALAPFVALSHLSYGRAIVVWNAVGLLAMLLAARMLARIARVPIFLVVTVLLLSLGTTSLILGQVVPIAFAAICAAGIALHRNDDRTAAFMMAFAAIEPHIALPVAASIAILRPRSRIWLAIVAIALVAATATLLGPAVTIEYLARVLPQHLHSELLAENQYALAPVIVQLGGSEWAAKIAGTLSSFVAAVAGILIAPAIARKTETNAAYAYTPAAFALLGGDFLHVTQLTLAIPLLFVLWGRVPAARPAAALGLLLLSVPWGLFGQLVAFLPLVGAVVAIVCFAMLARTFAQSAIAGVAAMAGVATLMVASAVPKDVSSILAPLAAPDRLAEVTWAAYISVVHGIDPIVTTLARLPSWLGLLAVCFACRSTLHGDARSVAAHPISLETKWARHP